MPYLFAAPVSIEEIERIGSHFSAPWSQCRREAGRTPVLSPAEYARRGFSIVAYPSSIPCESVRYSAGIEAIRLVRIAH